MNRLNKILLGALLAQLVLVWLVYSSSKPTAPQGLTPLLPGFDAAKVTRVQIFPGKDAQAGGASVPPEQPLDLVKRGEGWVVASRFDYPAQATAITELVGKLGAITHTGSIATAAARAKQLHVADDDFERKVVVTVDGKDHAVLLGNPVGSRQTAVRLGSAPAIYATSGLSPWGVSTSLRTFVSPAYGEAARDQITKIRIERAGSAVELSKDGAQWKASVDGAAVTPGAGEQLDTAVIDEVLGQVSQVELTDIADPKAADGKALATISVWTAPPAPPADPATPSATPGAAATPPPAAPTPPAAPSGPVAGSAPAAPPTSAAPQYVLTVLEKDASSFVARRAGASHPVVVDAGRLRTTVELAKPKLLKKQEKTTPAPTGPTPGAAPGELRPEQVPGQVSP